MDERSDPARRRLEALLNDERARRAHAERVLATERERVALWRRRAEQRAERIDRLTTTRAKLGRRLARLRRRDAGSGEAPAGSPVDRSAEAPTAATGETGSPIPALPAVVAAVDEPGRTLMTGLVSTESLADGGLHGADLAVVGPRSLESAALVDWARLEGRPPLLVVDDGSPVGVSVAPGRRDIVVTDHPDRWPGWTTLPIPLVARGLVPVPRVTSPVNFADGLAVDATGAVVGVVEGGTALGTALGQGVPVVGEPVGEDPSEWLRRSAVLTRRMAAEHRPAVVARRLLGAAGVDVPSVGRRIAAVLISNRPSDVEPAIRSIGAQAGVDLEVVVGLHGIGGATAARSLLDELGLAGEVVEMDDGWPLGRCMNQALDRISAPVWAKFDDDDVYGSHHLLDSLIALDATGADLVGKAVAYVHLESTDETRLYRQGGEDAWDQFVFGATFVGARALWDTVPFPHRHARIDSVFLTAARRIGARVYSTTRDEYMVVRRREAGHTWGADPDLFRSASTPAWKGRQADRVVVG